MALRIFFGIIRKVTIFYRLDFICPVFILQIIFFGKLYLRGVVFVTHWRLEAAANGGIKCGGPSTLDEFLF